LIVAVDRQFIGLRWPPFTVTVAADRLRQFTAAIGADANANAVPPPTYLKVIEGEGNSSREILATLGVDLSRVLHAEQEFEYHAPFDAGDQLTVERVVSDIYERKSGQLEFIVIDSEVRHAAGDLVGRSRQVILVRHTAAGAAA
jgi:acyl dehydratase